MTEQPTEQETAARHAFLAKVDKVIEAAIDLRAIMNKDDTLRGELPCPVCTKGHMSGGVIGRKNYFHFHCLECGVGLTAVCG